MVDPQENVRVFTPLSDKRTQLFGLIKSEGVSMA